MREERFRRYLLARLHVPSRFADHNQIVRIQSAPCLTPNLIALLASTAIRLSYLLWGLLVGCNGSFASGGCSDLSSNPQLELLPIDFEGCSGLQFLYVQSCCVPLVIRRLTIC